MNKFLQIIKKHKTVRALLSAQVICDFATWFVHMAIYTLLLSLNAPIWAITLTAAIAFFSGVIFAPISGTIVDRVSTKPMLIFILCVEILTAVGLLFINSLEYLWLLFALLFIRMSFATLYFQAVMALFPKILKGDELKLVNELNSIIWSIAYTLGMGVAGVWVHYFGVNAALLVNIVLYILATYIVIKTDIANFIKKSGRKFLLSMREGLIYLKKHSLLIHLMLLHASIGLTTYDALVVLLVKFDYPTILSIPLAIGLIDAMRSIALAIGTFTFSKYINKNNLFWFFIFQGLAVIFWAVMQFDFYFGLFGVFVAGTFTALLWSFTYTLIQNNTKEKFYGRVIAYNDMIFLSSATLTSLGIGFLYEHGLALNGVTALIGVLFILFGFYYKWINKRYTKI